MNKNRLKKRVLLLGYALNALASIVWPLLALLILHLYHNRAYYFLADLFGFTILAAAAVSVLLKNRFLYVLNIFSGVIFLNGFVQSTFPMQFIHIDFVIYAILTVLFFIVEVRCHNIAKNNHIMEIK